MAVTPTSPPWWREPRWWGRAGLTYLLATGAGFAASHVGLPLPWMLGPFFVCGALSAFGAPLAFVPLGRELAQLAVGLAVGLRFTPATLAATLALLPAMVAATLYVMAYTFLAALILRPLAKTDAVTAFFATAAGGVADMAIVARQKGGEAGPVAIVHALRVSATVAIIPILVVTFGAHGTAVSTVPTDPSGVLWLALVAVAAFAFVQLLKKSPLPNPWLVGPMLLGIAIGATGVLSLRVPPVAIVIAQIALGTWLGCRFRRDILTALPRVAAAGVLISLFMILCAGLGAIVMSLTTELSVATAFLALAPAAVTEMAITAKAMQLDAEIVTAFHVMRIAIVCSTVLAVYKLYTLVNGVPHGSRV